MSQQVFHVHVDPHRFDSHYATVVCLWRVGDQHRHETGVPSKRALASYSESEQLLQVQATGVPTAAPINAGDTIGVSKTTETELERAVDILHIQTILGERPATPEWTWKPTFAMSRSST